MNWGELSIGWFQVPHALPTGEGKPVYEPIGLFSQHFSDSFGKFAVFAEGLDVVLFAQGAFHAHNLDEVLLISGHPLLQMWEA